MASFVYEMSLLAKESFWLEIVPEWIQNVFCICSKFTLVTAPSHLHNKQCLKLLTYSKPQWNKLLSISRIKVHCFCSEGSKRLKLKEIFLVKTCSFHPQSLWGTRRHWQPPTRLHFFRMCHKPSANITFAVFPNSFDFSSFFRKFSLC